MENLEEKNVYSEMVPSLSGFSSSDESLCLSSLWKERFCVETKTVPLANDYRLNDNELPDLEIIEVNSNERMDSKFDTLNNNDLKLKLNTKFSSDFEKNNELPDLQMIAVNSNERMDSKLDTVTKNGLKLKLNTKFSSDFEKNNELPDIQMIAVNSNERMNSKLDTFTNNDLKLKLNTKFISDFGKINELPDLEMISVNSNKRMDSKLDTFTKNGLKFKLNTNFNRDFGKKVIAHLLNAKNQLQTSTSNKSHKRLSSSLDFNLCPLQKNKRERKYFKISSILKENAEYSISNKTNHTSANIFETFENINLHKNQLVGSMKNNLFQTPLTYDSSDDFTSDGEKTFSSLPNTVLNASKYTCKIKKESVSDKVINSKTTLRNGYISDVLNPCYVKLVPCDYNEKSLSPRPYLFESTHNLKTNLNSSYSPQEYSGDKDWLSKTEKYQTTNSLKLIAAKKSLLSEFSNSSEFFSEHLEGTNILNINMEKNEGTLPFSKFMVEGNHRKLKKKKKSAHVKKFSTGILNFIDINLDSGKPFFHRAIQDIWGFINTNQKPPHDLVTRIVQDILLDCDSKNLVTNCYTLLCHIVSLHGDITGPVPWWSLLETIMSNLEHCECDIKRYSIDLALQWIVVDVIEKNLHNKDKSIDKSLAKRLFWNVNRESRIKIVINWIRLALSQILNHDYYSNKKSDNVTVLVLCQKLLRIAVFVSDNPLSTANIISNELIYLYLYQPSLYHCKLFLRTLKCHLVCRTLVLTLLENYCEGPAINRNIPLTVQKIFEVYFKCSPRKDQHTPPRSPQDNNKTEANKLEDSCEELIQFLFHLLDSHLTIISNDLHRPNSNYYEVVTWNPMKLKHLSSEDIDCLKNMTTHIENLHKHLGTFCPTFTKVEGEEAFSSLKMTRDIFHLYIPC